MTTFTFCDDVPGLGPCTLFGENTENLEGIHREGRKGWRRQDTAVEITAPPSRRAFCACRVSNCRERSCGSTRCRFLGEPASIRDFATTAKTRSPLSMSRGVR